MKVKFLIGMFLLAGSANAFAVAKVETKMVATRKATEKKTEVASTSCTVRVKTGGYDVTITNTYDCSRRGACDGAYKIASLLL